MKNEPLINIQVFITQREMESEKLDILTRQLKTELHETGVESVWLLQTTPPSGAKSIDPIVLGALVLAVAPPAVTKLLDFLQAWTLRKEGRTIKLKLQNTSGTVLETEFPSTMSQAEVKNWVKMMSENISKLENRE